MTPPIARLRERIPGQIPVAGFGLNGKGVGIKSPVWGFKYRKKYF